MKRISLLTLAACLTQAAVADELDCAFLEFIKTRASELRAGDEPPASPDEWQEQRDAIRDHLLKAWGGFPDTPCPLNPRVLGELQRYGYRVEKVLFQTMPDVWMTANAYAPDRPGRLPAVLCVHGHWPGAKQDPHVQARCIGLAKLGFFVLAVDALGAGERGVGEALGEYHGEMTAATLWPIGRPLSGLQVYENMRAVDYLLTRPEVDGARLGITGASGGGNQAMYAGAWDKRFKAVVPVCSVGNYQAYLGAACCMCEVVPGALKFTGEWGVLSLTAPRALMVINATKDAVQFSVGEAEKSLALVEPVYQLHGKPENVRHSTFESGHDYSQAMREAMYGWMTLHLKGEGDGAPIAEPAMETEDPETLRCFPGESRPDDWMTIPKLAAREGRKLVEGIQTPATSEELRKRAAELRKRLEQDVLGGTEPGPESRQPTLLGSEWYPTIAFQAEPGIRLTATRYSGQPSEQTGVVMILSLDGAVKPETNDLAKAARDSGRTVVSLCLRATGQLAYPRDAIGRAPDHNTAEWSLWIGRPLLGQWVCDVRAALNALEANGDDLKDLTVVGIGPAGAVALCAGALDSRIDQVVTVGTLTSYISDVPCEGQRLGIMAPGMLRDVGDIPQLAALIAPRRLVIAGGVDGAGKSLGEDSLKESFSFTREVYLLEEAAGALSVVSSGEVVEVLKALESRSAGPRHRRSCALPTDGP
jgi:dienelactone hydrolase